MGWKIVEVSVGPKRYKIQFWWEIQPFLSYANFSRHKSTILGLEVEDGGDTRAGRSLCSEDSGKD